MTSQSQSQSAAGVFVISLDFELHWGVCDRLTVNDYRANLIGAREAVPRMLELFREYAIHATWATVGFLFFGTRDDLLGCLPARRPAYLNERLSAYGILGSLGRDEHEDPFHFGRELVLQIRDTPNQEIATHTFSHFYCLEPGQTPEDFRADLLAAQQVASSLGIQIRSIVFPRNQCTSPHLAVCADLGIRVYRGTERSWAYRAARADEQGLLRRALRLADSYLNITGHQTASLANAVDGDMVNIPASRFLRPYHPRLRHLDGLKIRRITRAMTHAAREKAIYHLWWHPHNTGGNLSRNLAELRKLLEHFKRLADEYGMRSLTMAETAAELTAGRGDTAG